MILMKVREIVKKFSKDKYEPRPLARPLWEQVYWFAFLWSVMILGLLVKFGLPLSWPANWNATICIREESTNYTRFTRLFYVDHPAVPPLPNLQLDVIPEYITTNHAIVSDLCRHHSREIEFIHDEMSQAQVWEQQIYDNIVSDFVLDGNQTIMQPLDIVVIMPGTSEHCFGELPVAKLLNPELLLILTSDIIHEDDLREINSVLGAVRSEHDNSSPEPLDTFSRWAKILRHLGLIDSSASSCHTQSTIIKEIVNPKHNFGNLLSPSFKLVLFGPILASAGVAFTSRSKLLGSRVAQVFKQRLADLKRLRFRRSHVD